MRTNTSSKRLVIVASLAIALSGVTAHQPAISQAVTVCAMARSELSAGPATVAAQANGFWSPTGDLNAGRYLHTATLLPDGKVLVAGGTSSGRCCTPTSTAELYDPITGTWSATENLNTARFSHSATLLQNGQVMVAGGYGGYAGEFALNSAELYDPATRSWHHTGSFTAIQEHTSATGLLNGKVLAVGVSSAYLGTAELYDPATGTWSGTGAPSVGGHVVLLSSGKSLAVSEGSPWDYGEVGAELYDPDTGTWSPAGSLNMFWSSTVTMLRNGKVLVTGLYGANNPTQAEIFDADTGAWILTDNLRTFRHYGGYTATLLADGQVLVAGGVDYNSSKPVGAEELYDPTTGTWSLKRPLISSRRSHTATLLQNGEVLVAGGLAGSLDKEILLSSAELYHPETGPIPIGFPKIFSASVEGKRLVVAGDNFDVGAVILLNGEEQKTRNDPQNLHTSLIGKKAGKKVKPGATLQVRNFDGRLSQEFIFTGS